MELSGGDASAGEVAVFEDEHGGGDEHADEITRIPKFATWTPLDRGCLARGPFHRPFPKSAGR